MLSIKEMLSATRTRLKTRDLARTRHWLDAILRDQDRIIELVGALGECRDASSWLQHGSTLRESVRIHFGVEQDALDPAIVAIGLRAHVVVARMSRNRLLHDLDDLRIPSWEDDGRRVRQLGIDMASHFAQQESCAYRAVARQQDEPAGTELSRRCLAILARHAAGRPSEVHAT